MWLTGLLNQITTTALSGGGGVGGGGRGCLYFIGMNVFWYLQLVRAYRYALHVSGTVNTQGFVWTFLCTIDKFLFIHSFKLVTQQMAISL